MDIVVPLTGHTNVRIFSTASDFTPFVVRGNPFFARTSGPFALGLVGLKEPYVFKRLVESKITASTTEVTSTMSGLVDLMSNTLTEGTDDSSVLAQIRDELKRHNDLLESQRDIV